jgi:hypothetical protein
MPDQYLTFKTFPDSNTAQDFATVLQQADIPYTIEEDAVVFDPSYANNQFNKDYHLKVRPQDFGSANQVLDDYYKAQLDKVEKDYYLFSFTDEELQEILAKPDEWGHFDYQLAKKLLAERGKEVRPEQTQKLWNRRVEELAAPEGVKSSSIVINYFVAFFFFPVGLFIGWHWMSAKKTLPDGERVLMYSYHVQQHGMRIFVIAIVMLILSIVGKIMLSLP